MSPDTDVSEVTDRASTELDVCEEGEHVIRNPPGRFKRECAECGYTVQTLVTWVGHDLDRPG